MDKPKQCLAHSRGVRIKDGKKTYPRIKKSLDVPREEWVGVPVPDSGIPREWVLAARQAIENYEKTSNCGRRFWELTGGVLRCMRGRDVHGLHYPSRNRLLRSLIRH